MMKQYFKELIDLVPSLGSYIGDRKYNNRYENSLSPTFENKMLQLQKQYLKKSLNAKQSIDNEMLKWITSIWIEGYQYNFDMMPLVSFQNTIIDFVFSNATNYPLKTIKDLNDLTMRYKSFKKYIQSCQTKMEEGMIKGYVISKMICKKMIKYLKGNLKNGQYIVEVPEHLKRRYAKTYDKYMMTVEMYYKVPVENLMAFLENVYYPACRSTIGLCSLPNGKAMYAHSVKEELTMENIDINDIHNYGVAEITRISKEMHIIKVKLGYPSDMPLQEFYNEMITNPKYQVTSSDELIQLYNQKKDEIRQSILTKYFEFSVKPYEIKKVPKSVEKTSAAAFYMSANKNTGSPGIFYINCLNLQDNFTYSVAPLSLHEGEPGHHYQCQYIIDKKLPDYRIYLLGANVFVEGWALYAESFIDENDALQLFGKLTFELFRASRLVLDTGIHYFGWSYKQSVKYMQDNVPLGFKHIEAEIERYICMPGQALCYKIGEREILKWRQKYVAAFNGDTDEILKQFHTIMLEDGNIPMQVLENKINRICAKSPMVSDDQL
jgi:uncharacterized protein (DUF885 family)